MIIQYASLNSDIVLWKAHCGAATIGKRYIKFGRKGQCDLTGFVKSTGQRVEIEVKTGSAVLSKEQREFARLCLDNNVAYSVVRSFDDYVNFAKQISM
jgi:hypothetical protein